MSFWGFVPYVLYFMGCSNEGTARFRTSPIAWEPRRCDKRRPNEGRPMRKLLSITMILSALTTSSASAQTCDEVLNACDKTLKLSRDYILTQEEIIEMQAKRIENLTKKDESFLSSPTAAFILGMLVTGLTVRLVK